jgi:hypothetical protein
VNATPNRRRLLLGAITAGAAASVAAIPAIAAPITKQLELDSERVGWRLNSPSTCSHC